MESDLWEHYRCILKELSKQFMNQRHIERKTKVRLKNRVGYNFSSCLINVQDILGALSSAHHIEDN